MKNPWKFIAIMFAALVLITLVWQYVTVQKFDEDFKRLEEKTTTILEYAQEQGVVVPGEDRPEPPPPVNPEDVSADDDPYTGNEDAKATIIVFDDFECPFCGKMHETLSEVRKKFSDGELRIVYRDFPLSGHKNALPAAKAAAAAREQGKYFRMADLIFDNLKELSDEKLLEFAEELGLDMDQFKKDLEKEEFQAEIDKDMEDAKSYGVTGTPAVFLNGEQIGGYLEVSALEEEIKEKLAE
ncbi:DsbA family protein [Patescibacteria group bacterium]